MDGRLLVTEKVGRLRVVHNGILDPRPIAGLPDNIAVLGQGGLLDVAIDPNFKRNQWVYFAYSGTGRGGVGTEVSRGQLVGHRLVNVQRIFVQQPKLKGGIHFGARLMFAKDGSLLVSLGDRGRMKMAQNPRNHRGYWRIRPDGQLPQDNPFLVGLQKVTLLCILMAIEMFIWPPPCHHVIGS